MALSADANRAVKEACDAQSPFGNPFLPDSGSDFTQPIWTVAGLMPGDRDMYYAAVVGKIWQYFDAMGYDVDQVLVQLKKIGDFYNTDVFAEMARIAEGYATEEERFREEYPDKSSVDPDEYREEARQWRERGERLGSGQ